MSNMKRNEMSSQESQLPAWIQLMRDAVLKCIKQEDIEAMVNKQVEKAKAGDEKAMKFVMEQILGGAALKGATFVQNNYAQEAPRQTPPARDTQITEINQIAKQAFVQEKAPAAAGNTAGLTKQQLEDRAIGLICEQCGFEPPEADRSKRCQKCNAMRWEQKAVPKMELLRG